jgi:hypothetical protein
MSRFRFLPGLMTALVAVGCNSPPPATERFTIQVKATDVTVTPSGPVTVLSGGHTAFFTVVATTGYTLSPTVEGTCPAGSWAENVYTTGAIKADCAVAFSATVETHQVTPSGANVTISPSGPQTVSDGGAVSFTVTPATGFTVSTAVAGSCPAGSWKGSVYTTGAIALDCTVVFSATSSTFQVTASGTNVSISPGLSETVTYGGTQAFTVTAATGDTLSSTVTGTCPAGSWAGAVYTTGAITMDCTVVFGATPAMFQVTPSGTNVTITPNTPQTVTYGATQAFTVTASTGYTVSNNVTGTCPSGTWAGNVYTTGLVTADCTVVFNAKPDTYRVTPSGTNVTIAPSSPQTVSYGATQAFTVTGATGYTASTAVGGTCPSGSWAGAVYTTGTITAACTVIFSATLNTYQVTPSGTNVTITPNTAQTVSYDGRQAFGVTGATGYTASTTVSGTCPSGSWAGAVYTTGTITADCTVIFSATVNTYQVTPSGTNVTITPNAAQTVSYNGTQAFTVTGATGYTASTTVGGTCPSGSWSGGVYTTGTITADCTVIFSGTLNTYQVTPSGTNVTITPNTAQTVSYGGTHAFTVMPAPGDAVSPTVTGTCPAGSWAASVYTTGAIVADCTVVFSGSGANGTPCVDGSGCLSGACVASASGRSKICCATTCADEGAPSCGTDGTCEASGSACAMYPSGTQCADPGCSNGSTTAAGTCDGNGTCDSGAPTSCGQYACQGSVCGTSCSTSADCQGGAFCSQGSCNACTHLCLQQETCPDSGTTSISGTVYAPNGVDPLPNVLVYVPNGTVQSFTSGVACGTCDSQITGTPLVQQTTSYDGTFTIDNMPGGSNIPLVIQIGRWRRQVTIPTVTACTNTALPSSLTHLPQAASTGNDIPLIAIVTGNEDGLECLFRKIGLEDSTFSDPDGTGRVRLFTGAGGAGAAYSASTPAETSLWGTQAGLDAYDAVFFACQGAEYRQSAMTQQRLINYANTGGRVLATHYSYVWLFNDAPFSGTADWAVDTNELNVFANDPQTAYINQSFAGGRLLAEWLQVIGASTIPGQVELGGLRDDFTGVVSPSNLWLNVDDATNGSVPGLGNVPMLYDFQTPIGSTSQCGHVMFNDFHVEESAGNMGLTFPNECSSTVMTPAEKLMEAMIFNLTACDTQ